MRFSFLAVLLSIASNSLSQGVQLKVYQNTDLFDSKYYNGETSQRRTVSNVNLSRISIAAAFSKKKLTHEFEIFIPEVLRFTSNLQFPKEISYSEGDGVQTKAEAYSFRYELSKSILKSKKFTFSAGVGINPYYVNMIGEPISPTVFYRRVEYYGATVNIIPRIVFNVTERIEIDLNIPFKIYTVEHLLNNIKNPSIPIRAQTAENMYYTFFDQVYTARLGIVYQLKSQH